VAWIWGSDRIVCDGKKILFDTGIASGVVLGIKKERGIIVNAYLSSIEIQDNNCIYHAKGRITSIDVTIENCKEIQKLNKKLQTST